jgi:antitoxin protein of toxin-antitoxin system
MGLVDSLKGLRKKAADAAVEHEDEIRQTVQKAQLAADQRTGGKYHDQIQNAGAKADTFIEGLKESQKPQGSEGTADRPAPDASTPPAS